MKKFTLVTGLLLLLALILFILLSSCAAPYTVVEIYTTDSLGRTVKTVEKHYTKRDSVYRTYEIVDNHVVVDPFWPHYYTDWHYRYRYYVQQRIHHPMSVPRRVTVAPNFSRIRH